MSHEVSRFSAEQNEIALNRPNLSGGEQNRCRNHDLSKLPELTAAGPKYESGRKLTIVKKENLGWLTKEETDEIIHRCDCHDDLVAACEAHQDYIKSKTRSYDNNSVAGILSKASLMSTADLEKLRDEKIKAALAKVNSQ